MSALPRLRHDLDFMPSPIEDHPGLLIRDSFHYSEAVLVVPPALVPVLACFDGEQTEADLRAHLVRLTGQLDVSAAMNDLREALHRSGFLHDEVFEEMRDRCEREFAQSPVREAAHVGSAYPGELPELQTVMQGYLASSEPPLAKVPVAIAAPHVSPSGGWECYRAAYAALPAEARERTFVILGTSHYGEPDRFGLTAKPFATPWGVTQTAPDLLKHLETQPAAKMEDYCHAVEHSIEFQVLFLQSIFGADICVLPILVGSFGRSFYTQQPPEANEDVRRFFDALRDLHSREKLLWVLGVDMAHMGRRYGDKFDAIADEDTMAEVAVRDHSRMKSLNDADPRAFWDQIQENRDDLKWCGSAPALYIPPSGPERARHAAKVRTMEHRSHKRRELSRESLSSKKSLRQPRVHSS